MRPGLVLLTAGSIMAVPVLALVLMLAAGAVAAGPALAAMAASVTAGIGFAALWAADLAALHGMLRRAAGEGGAVAGPRPRLPPCAALAGDIDRLARDLAARAAQVGLLRQTDQAIVALLPDPLIVLGADRAVERTNAAAREAFGADLPAVLRHPTLRAAIERAYAQDTPQRAQLSLPVPVPREVHATVIRLAPDGGQAMLVMSDRTRERAVERVRADFVANASHELRTPLASLVGFIDTLRGPAADDPPAQQRFLGIMAEQAARMNRLIDDLLSLSRIELTEHQPPAGRVDLAGVIARTAAAFEPRLAQRRMALELAVVRGLPEVPGDAEQLTQVVQNLLDNAVKYGREGGRVRLSAASAEEMSRWPGVVVAVADDGIGIAREHLARLTERFYRVDQGRSRAAGGTGLGLAIVKHIVNRHRGRLLIESEPGRGSTFSVWLPQKARGSAP